MIEERALIVEDDPSIGDDLTAVVEDLGLDVDRATGVSDAHKLLKTSFYRLVLLDLGLQDGSGFDLLAELTGTSPMTAVVVVSSTMDIVARNRCMKRGARDVVSKPFYPEELSRRLRRALGSDAGPNTGVGSTDPQTLTVGPLQLNLHARTLSCGDRHRRLGKAEATILQDLMQRPGQAVSLVGGTQFAVAAPSADGGASLPSGQFARRRAMRRVQRAVQSVSGPTGWRVIIDDTNIRLAPPIANS